jgi:two-component system chemotaxis response regulator CheY
VSRQRAHRLTVSQWFTCVCGLVTITATMGDRPRILLVDDSRATARQLARVIEELQAYEVVGHAVNGAEALVKYEELKPDLVCMDLVMPVMGGIEAIRSLLQLDAAARVVVVSSWYRRSKSLRAASITTSGQKPRLIAA